MNINKELAFVFLVSRGFQLGNFHGCHLYPVSLPFESSTLTLADGSEVSSTLGVFPGSSLTYSMSPSYVRRVINPGNVLHCSMFSPSVNNSYCCGSQSFRNDLSTVFRLIDLSEVLIYLKFNMIGFLGS